MTSVGTSGSKQERLNEVLAQSLEAAQEYLTALRNSKGASVQDKLQAETQLRQAQIASVQQYNAARQ